MNDFFSKNGVLLEHLQTLAEVLQAGSFALAAKGDSNRATLISRQMTELEEGIQAAVARARNTGQKRLEVPDGSAGGGAGWRWKIPAVPRGLRA